MAARELGLSVLEITGFSVLVFAGTGQPAAVELLAQAATVWVVVLTAVLINARFAMFSASLELSVGSFSRAWTRVAGFLVTTPAFVLSAVEFDSDRERYYHYLGTGLPLNLN